MASTYVNGNVISNDMLPYVSDLDMHPRYKNGAEARVGDRVTFWHGLGYNPTRTNLVWTVVSVNCEPLMCGDRPFNRVELERRGLHTVSSLVLVGRGKEEVAR